MPHTTAHQCHTCPAGSYCVGTHLNPISCPAGFYCPSGTGYDWQPCPPGTFSNTVGRLNVTGEFSTSFLLPIAIVLLQELTVFFIVMISKLLMK